MVSPPHYIRTENGVTYAQDSQEQEQRAGNLRRPVETVEFDVAVVAVEEGEKKGGIGIMVGSVGIGGQGKAATSNTSESRLKFTVPIILPQPRH